MPAPLEYKRRVRLADPDELPMPRPRRVPVLGVGLAAWLASVAVAWGVQAGTIPVARWLAPSPDVPAFRSRPRRVLAPLPPPSPKPALPPAPEASEPVPMAEPEPLPSSEPMASEPPAPATLAEAVARAVHAEPNPREEPTRPLEAARSLPLPETTEPAATPPSTPAVDEPAPAGGSTFGKSCETAAAEYSDDIVMGADRGPADLGAGDYSRVLGSSSWFAHCGLPSHAALDVCVAVQGGRAKGVTVRATPRLAAVERCVARAAAGLAFPYHPRLDVARTRFSAE